MRLSTAVVAILLCLPTALPALAEQRMVSVGDRRIAVYCDGKPGRFPTVILVPAGGRTAKDWDMVQPAVARFTRVCSYDHANFGQSDRAPVRLQSVDEVVDDMHAWLQASREKGPFVLVSHSNSGIYVRRFETRNTSEVAGLVFLDSAHDGIPSGPSFKKIYRSVPRAANIASQKRVATGSKETSRSSSFKQFAMFAGWRVPDDQRYVTTCNRQLVQLLMHGDIGVDIRLDVLAREIASMRGAGGRCRLFRSPVCRICQSSGYR